MDKFYEIGSNKFKLEKIHNEFYELTLFTKDKFNGTWCFNGKNACAEAMAKMLTYAEITDAEYESTKEERRMARFNLILWDAYGDYRVLEKDEPYGAVATRKEQIEEQREIVELPYGRGTTANCHYELEIVKL